MDRRSSRVRVETVKPSRWSRGAVSAWIFFRSIKPERVARLAPQKNVRRHVEIVQDVEFLVDERDAEAHGVVDVLDFDRLAVNV